MLPVGLSLSVWKTPLFDSSGEEVYRGLALNIICINLEIIKFKLLCYKVYRKDIYHHDCCPSRPLSSSWPTSQQAADPCIESSSADSAKTSLTAIPRGTLATSSEPDSNHQVGKPDPEIASFSLKNLGATLRVRRVLVASISVIGIMEWAAWVVFHRRSLVETDKKHRAREERSYHNSEGLGISGSYSRSPSRVVKGCGWHAYHSIPFETKQAFPLRLTVFLSTESASAIL